MTEKQLKQILVVDDDPDIRALVSMSLETIGGFSVHLCASGKEALDNAPHLRPDLILIDVMMPEMDGPATLQALRKIPVLSETPVIFLTAKDMVRESPEIAVPGAIGVIPKPFDPMSLPLQVREIWKVRGS